MCWTCWRAARYLLPVEAGVGYHMRSLWKFTWKPRVVVATYEGRASRATPCAKMSLDPRGQPATCRRCRFRGIDYLGDVGRECPSGSVGVSRLASQDAPRAHDCRVMAGSGSAASDGWKSRWDQHETLQFPAECSREQMRQTCGGLPSRGLRDPQRHVESSPVYHTDHGNPPQVLLLARMRVVVDDETAATTQSLRPRTIPIGECGQSTARMIHDE